MAATFLSVFFSSVFSLLFLTQFMSCELHGWKRFFGGTKKKKRKKKKNRAVTCIWIICNLICSRCESAYWEICDLSDMLIRFLRLGIGEGNCYLFFFMNIYIIKLDASWNYTSVKRELVSPEIIKQRGNIFSLKYRDTLNELRVKLCDRRLLLL